MCLVKDTAKNSRFPIWTSPDGLTENYSAQKKKSFRPETGPEFSRNDKNPKHFESNVHLIPTSICLFVCFGAESFFFLSTVCIGAHCENCTGGLKKYPDHGQAVCQLLIRPKQITRKTID